MPSRTQPIIVSWQGRQLRVRHDDPRITSIYSPQAVRVRAAVGDHRDGSLVAISEDPTSIHR
jgi:hypothetical protein